MIGRKLSNFGVLCEVGPFLKSAHIIYTHPVPALSTNFSNFKLYRLINKEYIELSYNNYDGGIEFHGHV